MPTFPDHSRRSQATYVLHPRGGRRHPHLDGGYFSAASAPSSAGKAAKLSVASWAARSSSFLSPRSGLVGQLSWSTRPTPVFPPVSLPRRRGELAQLL